MQITRQADYATRAILHLARSKEHRLVATSEIAREQSIPASFLAKIISQLSIAGLLRTSRGAHGGISLTRDPEQITLLEVIEAIDGPILINICVEGESSCTFGGHCPLQRVWCDIQKELVTKLKNTNFGQLSRSDR
jgi:Rrf2 family protein